MSEIKSIKEESIKFGKIASIALKEYDKLKQNHSNPIDSKAAFILGFQRAIKHMTYYEFLHTDSYECPPLVVSKHRTHKSAETAMNRHRSRMIKEMNYFKKKSEPLWTPPNYYIWKVEKVDIFTNAVFELLPSSEYPAPAANNGGYGKDVTEKGMTEDLPF